MALYGMTFPTGRTVVIVIYLEYIYIDRLLYKNLHVIILYKHIPLFL